MMNLVAGSFCSTGDKGSLFLQAVARQMMAAKARMVMGVRTLQKIICQAGCDHTHMI